MDRKQETALKDGQRVRRIQAHRLAGQNQDGAVFRQNPDGTYAIDWDNGERESHVSRNEIQPV